MYRCSTPTTTHAPCFIVLIPALPYYPRAQTLLFSFPHDHHNPLDCTSLFLFPHFTMTPMPAHRSSCSRTATTEPRSHPLTTTTTPMPSRCSSFPHSRHRTPYPNITLFVFALPLWPPWLHVDLLLPALPPRSVWLHITLILLALQTPNPLLVPEHYSSRFGPLTKIHMTARCSSCPRTATIVPPRTHVPRSCPPLSPRPHVALCVLALQPPNPQAPTICYSYYKCAAGLHRRL